MNLSLLCRSLFAATFVVTLTIGCVPDPADDAGSNAESTEDPKTDKDETPDQPTDDNPKPAPQKDEGPNEPTDNDPEEPMDKDAEIPTVDPTVEEVPVEGGPVLINPQSGTDTSDETGSTDGTETETETTDQPEPKVEEVPVD